MNSPQEGYDQIARSLAEQLNAVRQDPGRYAFNLDDKYDTAKNETISFLKTSDKLTWSTGLQNGARKYVNGAGPCDTELTPEGKNLFNSIVPEYVSTFGELNGVVYKGRVKPAKDVFITLLENKEFTKDMKTSAYTDVGAACACNPGEEMICALIFGKNLNT